MTVSASSAQGGKGRSVALVTQLETGSTGVLLDRWVQALGARPRVTFEPFAYEAIRAANRQTSAGMPSRTTPSRTPRSS